MHFAALADTTQGLLLIDNDGNVYRGEHGELVDAIYVRDCKFDPGMPITSTWASIPHSPHGIIYTGDNCPAWVGIETNSPSAMLEVTGTTNLIGQVKIGANSIYIGGANQNTGTNNSIYATDVLLQSDANNNFNTIINDGNAGKVGIGMNNPAHKLEVADTIRACRVLVENNAWCDFVFEDNYVLMPLNELEEYIKQNKHLPGVPSEKEAPSRDNDLAETDRMLLQKIEELTLYMIQQQKEIEELKRKLELTEKK
ncbi:MAG: hypothetical protein ACK4K0_11190 [Flavobacteriales bacterium]